MGLFNADLQVGSYFYRSDAITGLQPNTRYRFKGWITNILSSRFSGGLAPNVTLSVLDASTSAVVSSINTGDLAKTSPDDTLVWREYGLEFVTGPSQTSAVIQMSNNQTGGGGNDVAIDDLCLVKVTTDLSITKTNSVTSVNAGGTTSYSIVVSNVGPNSANGAIFQDAVATGLSKTSVTCSATSGAVCPVNPTVAQIEAGLVIPTLPAGSTAIFTVAATVTSTTNKVTNIATIATPIGLTDSNTTNNTASDTDTVEWIRVSGRVFADNSGTTAIAANAYNGTQEAGELGIARTTIQLTNCASTVVATTTTDAAGDYLFDVTQSALPTPNFCVVEQNVTSYRSVSGTTGYSSATDTITVANSNALSYTGHNFGDARLGLVLTSDGQQTTTPAGTVSYAHTLTAESVLTPTLATLTTQQPNNATDQGWTTILYLDNNCNGQVDGSEAPVGTLSTLLPNQSVCVVQRVNAPASASNGAQHVASLSASYVATVQGGATLSGSSQTRTDTTLVGTAGLDMTKQVRVVSSCPSNDSSSTGFAARNTAKNGDFLEYEIIYKNRSARNLSTVVVRDAVPSHALFKSALCMSTPSGAACAVSSTPAVNATGTLSWSITGPVAPNAQGSVRFCVQVPALAEGPQ
jgi:uncharacterized repeat protein (TIGR01451 family)